MALIARLIDIYSLIVLAAVILTWTRVDPKHPVAKLLRRMTEPVLAPIRRLIPPIGGLDLSPLVLMIALQLLKGLLS